MLLSPNSPDNIPGQGWGGVGVLILLKLLWLSVYLVGWCDGAEQITV